MKSSIRTVSEIGLTAVTHLVPVPGIRFLLNRQARRTARRVATVALLGAGVAVAVPAALYVICKTSGTRNQTN
jgi:hypothetical protein